MVDDLVTGLQAKVLTVSDGVIAGTREDTSGAALEDLLAGVGFEAGMVEGASRQLKNRLGPLAYILSGAQQLANFEPFRATVENLPAVVEAGLSEIPMIVLTADRPEELRGVGAPQTIDQIDLYGGHVAWFHDPGVPEAATAGEWRSPESSGRGCLRATPAAPRRPRRGSISG